MPYPDQRLGERACAFIVLREGRELSLSEMVEFLISKQCAKNYLPERLKIVKDMPRTPSGKIQKFVLRDQAKQVAPT